MASFSAKDLVSRSCMQIKMFAEHPERKPQPSAMIVYGEKYQKAVANTIPNIIGEEMRGVYNNGGLTINFSNDIVCSDKIIEVKSVSGSYEPWYLESSLVQCAFYKAMIMSGCNKLDTASFYVSMGHERKSVVVPSYIRYILLFGEEKYEIDVKNPPAIINFFVNKAMACYDWTAAKDFDMKYKHLEFDVLKKFFEYYSIF